MLQETPPRIEKPEAGTATARNLEPPRRVVAEPAGPGRPADPEDDSTMTLMVDLNGALRLIAVEDRL